MIHSNKMVYCVASALIPCLHLWVLFKEKVKVSSCDHVAYMYGYCLKRKLRFHLVITLLTVHVGVLFKEKVEVSSCDHVEKKHCLEAVGKW